MDTQAYLEEKKIESTKSRIKERFLAQQEGRPVNGILLKQESLEIGLWLLNMHPDGIQKEFTYAIPALSQGGKRFEAIKAIVDPISIWEEHDDLLALMFDAELVPLVKKAWAMFPQMAYQTGYSRRSFRGPTLTDIHYVNQLNFLINLISDLKYEIPLEEYIIYSNQVYTNHLAYLYAAAINLGDEKITTLLLDISYMRHEVGRVSRMIIKGMLLSDSEVCWEAVEKLLLTAQRQEGLRQTILECLDECSFGAMKRMIKVIIDHKLARFSSVVRAVDVWAGFNWESARESTVRRFLELAYTFLENPEKIPTAMKSRDNAEVYMALWAQGVFDVLQCPPLIEEALKQDTLEKTVISLYLIWNIGLTETSVPYGLRFMRHDNLMIFALALRLFHHENCIKELSQEQKDDLFELLSQRVKEIPKKAKTFTGKGFSWLTIKIDQDDVFRLMLDLIDFSKEAEVDKVLPFFEEMPLYPREKVARKIFKGFYYSGSYASKEETLTPPSKRQRDFAFRVLKDRAPMIREGALRTLAKAELETGELDVFVDMLKRKSADTRKTVLNILLKQSAEGLESCSESLLKARNQEQRLGGLDLLIQLKKQENNSYSWIDEKVNLFAERAKISTKEEILLNQLLVEDNPTLQFHAENGYGLYDPTKLSQVTSIEPVGEGIYTQRIQKEKYGLSKPIEQINEDLQSLKALFEANQDYEYTRENWDGSMESVLLGNNFSPLKKDMKGMKRKEIFMNYPLAKIWEEWFLATGLDAGDLRLINLGDKLSGNFAHYDKMPKILKKIQSKVYFPDIPRIGPGHWQNQIAQILKVLAIRFKLKNYVAYLEGLLKDLFATLGEDDMVSLLKIKLEKGQYYYYHREIIHEIYNEYVGLRFRMDDEQFTRFWQLDKWRLNLILSRFPEADEDSEMADLYSYARAYSLDLIGTDELTHRIMKLDAMNELTLLKKNKEQKHILETFPFLNDFLKPCRERILEIELKRGDSSTAVTRLAQNINRISGLHYFIDILNGMGKDPLHRGYIYSWGRQDYNKKEILSTLLKRCHPDAETTAKEFAANIKTTNITDERLIEAATYAPQWLPLVSEYLGWKGMSSGVWWLHAHANATHNSETEAEIGKYSKISLKDFSEGAVDTQWFKEVYAALGKTKWSILYDAAKYISESGGQKRAQLYADVMLGKTKITEIKKRIKDKRNQDYLRAFGLVPLSRKTPDKDVLNRYRLLQQFKKESKQFGAQRQASEGRSVQIAMENLARTADYPDPLRLTWAMETEEAQQILAKSSQVILGNVEANLLIDTHGQAKITYIRDGKKLKSAPAKFKKDKNLIALKAHTKTLREQYRRTRASLELAMVNGDPFKTSEILNLMNHPVVAPMLKKLVLKSGDHLGLWEEGKLKSIEDSEFELEDWISIAHCTDLYESKQWSEWQKYCFEHKTVQPFKQIFRELYLPTGDELNEKSISRRYAGHQVQPKKTVALLKTRGWIVDYETGLQKVFHRENFIAKMYAMADWFSPADVESPTLETIEFHHRSTYKNVAFSEVNPRVFSEVMRDIDLVVSVAHVGGIDPEASQSSIEMRKAIARETLRLFKLGNVRFNDNHALIEGEKGNYSVHLGSAVVHQVAGTYLSILPVHSQHRGRMFLPFIDDDPKSAEVLSKILLLAKDDKIQDPTILRQIQLA